MAESGKTLTADQEQAIMAEAERASVYYRTLCRNYVEPKHAEQITCAWILGHINADAARRLPRAPWDLDGDAP